jgi:hypothetical protein
MRIDIHHHYDNDHEILNRLENIMAELDDLKAQVEANRTVSQSALTLINGIAARIAAAGTDPAALKSLTDSLKSDDDALAAAVTANTPAA